VRELKEGLESLGFAPRDIVPLAGDASQRRFFRVVLAGHATIVAALYPLDAADQAQRDCAIQAWAAARGLPVPHLLGISGIVTVAEDVGDTDLERALATGTDVMPPALDALEAFQRCGWQGLATPPFDAAFFRRELALFERAAWTAGRSDPESAAFLDALAERVARHPFRLLHRDFHANNLFLDRGNVRTVDFQDMRAGPDTYDLVSLLRERAGGELIGEREAWMSRAAARFAWPVGWERRASECAAQRGLKVIGTFLRLAAEGRTGYLAWLAGAADHALDALDSLEAPEALCHVVAGLARPQRL
jgi:aminoglycoside/choline kinase family phosphotransferase